MDIQELVRGDYAIAVTTLENKARQCPAGSAEQNRWLEVAAVYRQLTGELAAPSSSVPWTGPAPVLAVVEK